jgi:hypothetical protein
MSDPNLPTDPTDISVPCGICPASIRPGEVVCSGCKRPFTDRDRAVFQVRAEGGDYQSYQRGREMRSASKWIGVLAVLFTISGGFMYLLTAQQAEKAMQNLAQFDDDTVLTPINGKVYTAGELRREVQREPLQVLVVNLIVAGLMGGLWYWARRAPLPAICCALALFIVVHVVSGVLDPSTIAKGILVKILGVAALFKGMKAALEARAAMQRTPH